MHHIIINPAAGRGQSLKILPELTSLFEADNMPFTVLRTGKPLEARGMAQKICAGGESKGIIAIGGDGTVQEIVAGMANAAKAAKPVAGPMDGASEGSATAGFVIPIPLGIIPCGSANDFTLTTHGRKRKPGAADIFERVKRRQTRAVDLIADSNGNTFINIANMGLDALIVKNAVDFKKYFGGGAYLAAAFKSIMGHRNLELEIELDGKKLSGGYTLIAVCNGQYYGGGMRIAPSASLGDGKITVVLVEAMSRKKTLTVFPSVIFEKHVKMKEVQTLTCTEITVIWKGTQTLCLDGNLFEMNAPVTFRVMPAALLVQV